MAEAVNLDSISDQKHHTWMSAAVTSNAVKKKISLPVELPNAPSLYDTMFLHRHSCLLHLHLFNINCVFHRCHLARRDCMSLQCARPFQGTRRTAALPNSNHGASSHRCKYDMALREWEALEVLTERSYTAPCVAMHNVSCHICMLTVCWPACIHSTQQVLLSEQVNLMLLSCLSQKTP